MQAAEQIQIGQNSLIARNNTGARQESEPTQTASGPESLDSTSPRSALSAAERSAGDLERASEYGWSSLGGARENFWL